MKIASILFHKSCDFHAAELVALRIGRGVLEKLGYQLPGKDEPTMVIDRWIDKTCAEEEERALLVLKEQRKEEQQWQQEEARRNTEALARILSEWGMPVDLTNPVLHLGYADVCAWYNGNVDGQEQWVVILMDASRQIATQYHPNDAGRAAFAQRLRFLRHVWRVNNQEVPQDEQ